MDNCTLFIEIIQDQVVGYAVAVVDDHAAIYYFAVEKIDLWNEWNKNKSSLVLIFHFQWDFVVVLLPSSIKIIEFVSGFDVGIVDGCCATILKSSSSITDVFHLVRAAVLGAAVIGAEYKLKFVGLITPDIFDSELE